ncbi:MAG TPA: hypothetical protein VHX87_10420, partial [Galbitalea sp.]|nr:hypothetical protein [Galbitalea sp.]
NNVSFEDVSVTFDNPSKTDVTFEVTSPDSTVTDYPVGAGESLGPVDVGPVSSDGGTFLVSIVGGDSLPNIVVGSFTGCIVTVHPVKPTVHRITTCGETGGSIDITLTAGIEYYVNGTLLTDGDYTSVTTGLTGTVHVTAVAENGYAFGQGDKSHWWLKLGEPSTCTVTLVTPVCTATNGGFYAPVTLTFDNPGKHGVSVDVTGGSIATSVDFTVPGHSTDWPYLVDANGQSGDVYTVTINGVVQAPIDLSFADCPITVYPTDPTVQDTTCTQATEGVPSVLVGGSITTDGNPNLTYTLYTVVGGNPTNPVVFPGNPSPVLSGLPGGQYLVTVASNNPDYIIGTPTDFPFTVALTDRDCGGTTLTPVVTSDDTCAATGIITTADSPVSKFQAAITYVDGGVINLPQQPGILVFKINGVEQDDTAVTEPNGGPYVVTVSLTSAAIADGYVLSDPDVSWTYSFDSFCPPTGATWNAGATGSNAVCTSGTTTDGVITLEHDTDQDGKVTYTITNDAAPTVIVYHGTNSTPGNTLVNVGAGHYTVTAKATDVADGLSGSTNPDGSETFNIHVTLTSSDCVGDLAFTGGTIAWLGFVLAGGMLFLGFALLYMRRRGHRTAE